MADQNFSDIPKGRRVSTQIPLNVKEWCKDEATLAYLGINDNLAFTYHDNIEIFCLAEKTLYRWREVQSGEENTGLVPLDFTYPSDSIVYNVDYSNKTYNFFPIEYQLVNNVITYTGTNIGTGSNDILKDITGTSTKSFNIRRPISNTINITVDGDNIRYELPETSEITQFYVNADYVGEETGSILKPYSKLTSALVAAIGNGDLGTPEFENANIILQTNVVVTQADLIAAPTLQNKISVNTLTIKSENGETKTINFQGTTDYPIDTEFLFNIVGIDVNLDLNRSIYMIFDSIDIYAENIKGIIRSKSYNRGVIDVTKPNSALTFNNGSITANHVPLGSYVIAKDSLNNNITLFGTNVYVQDNIVNDTPHVLAYGKGTNGEGAFSFNNSKITGTSQTHFKLLNTSFFSEVMEVTTNTFRMPTNDVTPVTPGVYLPKTDIYKIHVENSTCIIFNYTDGAENANNTTDGNVYVGGLNSYFRCENALLSQSGLRIDDGFIYDGYANYLLETDKDFGNRELINCNFSSLSTELGAFNYIGTVSGDKNVNIEGSEIKNVEDPSTSNITVSAISANVNGYMYSSAASFVDDIAAIAAGLIPGNIYYNTTISSLKRVD